MIVREPRPLVRQALMTAPLQTANDRAGSKLKAQLCIWSLRVLLISLRDGTPPRPLHISAAPLICTLWSSEWRSQCFYWRNYNQWVGSSKQGCVIVGMFALGNGQCCVFIWREKIVQGSCHSLYQYALQVARGPQVIYHWATGWSPRKKPEKHQQHITGGRSALIHFK